MRCVRTLLTLLLPLTVFACSSTNRAAKAPTPDTASNAKTQSAPLDPPISARIAQFAPAAITTDASHLSKPERATLDLLIDASRYMDPIYCRQAFAKNPEVRAGLAGDKEKLTYFDLMRGPWDRQDDFRPFAIDIPHPRGAGFYPLDMTEAEFKSHIANHPEDKEKFESLTTVIVRNGTNLSAVPYGAYYAEWLKPAAAKLREAADVTKNHSLATFLKARAAAFESDDYLASDKAWMDVDSPVEITIGPYETYEDQLLGLKGAFESFVTVVDPEQSKKLAKYKSLLPAMEQHLPISAEMHPHRGAESPIRVADVVFTAGEANKTPQTIAFNLPNDERVRAEKGAKKVLLKNLIQTKFERVMRPIGERIVDPSQASLLSAEAFFDEVLFHELSHSLGPAFVHNQDKSPDRVMVSVALGPSHAAIEECKADTMGAYNILYLIERGELPKSLRKELLVSYVAGLFRSLRFGADAHGQGANVQMNRYIEEGGASFDETQTHLHVDFDKLEKAIGHLVHDLCVLENDGDKAKADAFLAHYGKVSPPVARVVRALEGVPIDLRPIYPLAGE